MKSTFLLLKILRKKILLAVAVCFIASLIPSFDLTPRAVEKGYIFMGLSLMISLVMVSITGIYTDLFRVPAPVSHRQMAWVPTICLALCVFASVIGISLASFGLGWWNSTGYTLSLWGPVTQVMINSIPMLFFLFCVMDRIIRAMGTSGIGIVILINPMFIRPSFAEDDVLIQLYSHAWPLCIVLGIWFLWEAPRHIAAMEHPQLQQGVKGMYIRVAGSPRKHPLSIVLGDVFLILFCGSSVAYLFLGKIDFSSLGSFGIQIKFYSAMMGFFLLLAIRYYWRIIGAQRYTGIKKGLLLFMNFTGVLIPITFLMGAKRGGVGSCTQCTRYKFLWAPCCPHCGEENQGDPLVEGINLPGRRKNAVERLKQKPVTGHMIFRVMVPIYLLAFGVLSSSGIFYSESFTLVLKKEGVNAPEGSAEEIKAYLDAHEDVESWLIANVPTDFELPERYRI